VRRLQLKIKRPAIPLASRTKISLVRINENIWLLTTDYYFLRSHHEPGQCVASLWDTTGNENIFLDSSFILHPSSFSQELA
jgi:hypothetical protein